METTMQKHDVRLPSARTLADAAELAAKIHGDTELIVDSETRKIASNVSSVMKKAKAVAGNLQAQAIGRESVVAIQLPAWEEAVIAQLAVTLIGGIIVPLTPGFGASELGFIADQIRPVAVITSGEWNGHDFSGAMAEIAAERNIVHYSIEPSHAPEVQSFSSLTSAKTTYTAPSITSDDLAMIVYTSGTTSAQKGVKHTHATLLAELRQNIDDELRAVLSPWPPGHIAGCLGLMRFWAFGQPTILMDRWDPQRAAKLVEEHRIYGTSGTPLHLGGLLDAAEDGGYDLSSLTSYLAGATTIPAAIIDRCAKIGLATFRAYGSSEHPTISAGAPEDPLALRQGSDGHLSDGVRVRIVDDDGNDQPTGQEGEIWSNGPDLFLGYVDASLDEDAFAPGGWYKTGDIGRLDSANNLTITDRKKDIIIRAGETLSSREIEEHLAAIPGVLEAAVIGLPDERYGERICAVIRQQGAVELGVDDIDRHFRERGVARFKTPEHVVNITDFPRTTSGKIQKNILRKKILAAFA